MVGEINVKLPLGRIERYPGTKAKPWQEDRIFVDGNLVACFRHEPGTSYYWDGMRWLFVRGWKLVIRKRYWR